MRRVLIFAAILAVATGAAYWKLRPIPVHYEQGYAGGGNVTAWSSTAQVHVPVEILHFGEPVAIIEREGDHTHIRTEQGTEGWVETRDLLSAEDWKQAITVSAQAKSLPVMAKGHTKVSTNLRLEPGRDGMRLLQLEGNVKVEMLGRQEVQVPGGGASRAEPKREDWWEVRAQSKNAGEVGGWVLARFISLDLPEPLPEYASAAGMRVVAWFELNHVMDADGKEKPQYLAAGTKLGEGGACDFTKLLVFTWGSQRARFETAYVESNLCGKLPIQVTAAMAPGGDSSFGFEVIGMGGEKARREYRMVQTQVRLVSGGEASHAAAGKRMRVKP
jgi:hypothetical protein